MKITSAPTRLRSALGAGASTALVVALGVALGHADAGLTASIGAFTALYAVERPYRSRAKVMGAIALTLAAVVALGLWAKGFGPLAPVALVTVVAAGATFFCNAFAVGPPGAYMLALAAATGTALPGDPLGPIAAGLVVLAGGALSAAVQMAGFFVSPRAPERSALARAEQAVDAFMAARGTPAEFDARHAAASALHEVWIALTNQQPRASAGPDLAALRRAAFRLHLVFVEGYRPETAAPPLEADALPSPPPLGGPTARDLVAEALSPWSPPLTSALRVGLATALAGLCGAALGVDRVYWAMASAVLVLHQGLGRRATWRRAAERIAGTALGLGLAALSLVWGPRGFALAAWLGGLQFGTEMLVVRRYVLAVVLITTISLTIGAGGAGLAEAPRLLLTRGLDTVLGCAIGLAVFLATRPKALASRLRAEIVVALEAALAVTERLAARDVASPAGRAARRLLQRAALRLLQAYQGNLGVSGRIRERSEPLWPAIALAEELAYALLAASWRADLAEPPAGAWGPLAAATKTLIAEARTIDFEDPARAAAFCTSLRRAAVEAARAG